MNRADMIAMLERVAAHCAREDWKAALAELDGALSNAGEADDEVTAARIYLEAASVKAGGTAPGAAIDCIDNLRDALIRKIARRVLLGSPQLWINTALQNLGARA